MPKLPSLRYIRERAALSQAELATLARVGGSTIGRTELGTHDPRPFTTRKLAAVLGVQPAALMEPLDGSSEDPSQRRTCREELLDAVTYLIDQSARSEFTLQEALAEMRRRGSRFGPSTIQTQLTTRLCVNSPSTQPRLSDDFYRVRRGVYRLFSPAPEASGNPYLPLQNRALNREELPHR